LRDCYIDWPAPQVKKWALAYLAMLQKRGVLQTMEEEKFLRCFDFMGLQRHLKALMTFARKKVRDQQPQYLAFIPRTLDYIVTVSEQYKELAPLHDYYLKVKQLCVR
jgi:aminoglycoside/choline kinase family phosphotransferase